MLMTPVLQTASRYGAFISYSHSNAATARWLHRELEAYRTPRALVGREGERGLVARRVGRVFRDEEELPGAAELGPKLQGALRDADALIVICSVEAARSRWVNEEIRFFRSVNPGRPVLAVIVNGVPGGEPECFPESLRFGVAADGQLDRAMVFEPLAPDLQKLERHAVKLKLIAGLLGISYGELAQRDQKRLRRQVALGSSLALAVISALLVLSVTALSYAHMAVQQRDIARRNADLAERKAWLANTAAQEIRREALLIAQPPATCPQASGR